MPQKARDIRHDTLHLDRKKAMRFSAAAAWSWNTETGEAAFAPEWGDILAAGRQSLDAP
jgi:hypothetical protein